jgi:hypothetical protein
VVAALGKVGNSGGSDDTGGVADEDRTNTQPGRIQ